MWGEWRKGWKSVGGECGEEWGRCEKVCWGVGGGGVCGKMWGRWSVWKNVGEVWESVLGCRGSNLKRGVGEVRRGGGVKKCVAGVGGKVWRVGKNGRGVGKCFGCGRN